MKSHKGHNFLSGVSPEYIDHLNQQFIEDPDSLPMSWRLFFEGIEVGKSSSSISNGRTSNGKTNGAVESENLEHQVALLIKGYRQRGHLAASLDPLNRPKKTDEDPRLDLKLYGLDKVSPDKKFDAAQLIGLPPSPLKTITSHLQETYCKSIGIEYMHISDQRTLDWLEARMEPNKNRTQFSNEDKKQILNDIAEATLFEDFLQKNFTGQKRFSLEGAESLIPAMKQVVRRLGQSKHKEVVLGMAHRGRLNVLVNVMKKPYGDVFSEFFGAQFSEEFEEFESSGDVKYHLGYSTDVNVDGQPVHISMAFNPSHLEAIGPVVEGMTKAKQFDNFNSDPRAIAPLLIHGDAAVIGQGVVTETLNLSGIDGYDTGGTIHIVINNQVGFTTFPEESRTSSYCTDFAKAIQAPVIHVNGEDVEAVVHAMSLAIDFRSEFLRDVFVDIYSYRKYGHNEGDEPRFTQPKMYDIISKKKNPLEIYQDQLIKEKQVDSNYCQDLRDQILGKLESAINQIKENPKQFNIESLGKSWQGLKPAKSEQMLETFKAPIDAKLADELIEGLHHIPKEIKPLPKVSRMLEKRLAKIKEEKAVDWAVAEQLAFASLLQEGYNVRLSGQDSKRGTFSHRHIELRDIKTEETFMPIRQFENNSKFYAYNSPLSEYAVLGFDFGYSSSSPKTLTLWEAQFGDFANGAQIMMDQFISSTESKWRRMNGIVLLLPHGYEGQGPEHSSARLERFLQLAGGGNFQVAYPTTAAQFCHILRRQVKRDFRKPLIIMSPKSPLRMPEVSSPLTDITEGHFQNLILSGAPAKTAKRLVFCTGKVYWDLVKKAGESGQEKETAFVRVEQLYPLDLKAIEKIKSEYKAVKDWVWCQEEPKNMGAWGFFCLETAELNLPWRYAGRKRSASPATGNPKRHIEEQEHLVNEALGLTSEKDKETTQ